MANVLTALKSFFGFGDRMQVAGDRMAKSAERVADASEVFASAAEGLAQDATEFREAVHNRLGVDGAFHSQLPSAGEVKALPAPEPIPVAVPVEAGPTPAQLAKAVGTGLVTDEEVKAVEDELAANEAGKEEVAKKVRKPRTRKAK